MVTVGGHSDAGTGTWFMSNLFQAQDTGMLLYDVQICTVYAYYYRHHWFLWSLCLVFPLHATSDTYVQYVKLYIYIYYIHITFWVADARNPQVCQCASIPRPSIWWRSRSLLLERPCEDQSLKTLKELRVNRSFSSLWTLLLQGLVLEKILDVEKMTAEWGPYKQLFPYVSLIADRQCVFWFSC